MRLWQTTLIATFLWWAPAARAADPTAEAILRRADAILAPREFEATITFTSRKANGTAKTFAIHMWKKDADKTRFRFLSPADDRDMEVLRVGDDMWNYLPNLKRSLRISPKQEFHGGDFSNSDMLRVDLVEDYTPTVLPSASPDEWLLELTAKNDQVAYHRVRYFIAKRDFMPRRQEFYAQSGKLVRRLEMSAPKVFGRLVRPSRYVMKNMLVAGRETEMVWDTFAVKPLGDDGLFAQASLGR